MMKIKNIYQGFNLGVFVVMFMILIFSFVEQITTGFLLWMLIGYSIYVIGRYFIESGSISKKSEKVNKK